MNRWQVMKKHGRKWQKRNEMKKYDEKMRSENVMGECDGKKRGKNWWTSNENEHMTVREKTTHVKKYDALTGKRMREEL